MPFWAGFCYGLALGIPAAWYANSHHGFGGSDSALVWALVILFGTTGTGLRMRARRVRPEP